MRWLIVVLGLSFACAPTYGESDSLPLPPLPADMNDAIKMTLATWIFAEDGGLDCQKAISWNASDRPKICSVFNERLKWAKKNSLELADRLENEMPRLSAENTANLDQLSRVSHGVNAIILRIDQMLPE